MRKPRGDYEHGTNVDYAFPVSLQPVFTKDGNIVPTVRAVVREDDQRPISSVSDKFTLIPHEEVVTVAQNFLATLGPNPETIFTLTNDGAVLMCTCTFKDKTFTVGGTDHKVGDPIGLRVHIENAYNGTKCLRFKIGGINISCLNGMVAFEDFFNISIRHTGSYNLDFPEAGEVFDAFKAKCSGWDSYGKIMLNPNTYGDYVLKANEEYVIPEKLSKALVTNAAPERSVWQLYNDFTYYVTHDSKASPVGKVNKLNRIDKWFSQNFSVGAVH